MLGSAFDPNAEFAIRETCKPHWAQAGAVVFLTFRLADSLPRELLRRWDRERIDWLRRCGVSVPRRTDWKHAAARLDSRQAEQFRKHFRRQYEDHLDLGLGDCLLGQPWANEVVQQSLMRFDGERYRMGDYVVMPNHVHALVVFPDPQTMSTQCAAWMRFTARRINRRLNRTGRLWQPDPFDHLVRSPEQYDYLRHYIEQNPIKAGLKSGFGYRRSPS